MSMLYGEAISVKEKTNRNGHRYCGVVVRVADDSPELAGVMANLGALYLRQGRAPEAVAILRQAVEQDPRNLESRTNLISALGMEGDVDGARHEVEVAADGLCVVAGVRAAAEKQQRGNEQRTPCYPPSAHGVFFYHG